MVTRHFDGFLFDNPMPPDFFAADCVERD